MQMAGLIFRKFVDKKIKKKTPKKCNFFYNLIFSKLQLIRYFSNALSIVNGQYIANFEIMLCNLFLTFKLNWFFGFLISNFYSSTFSH